MAARGSASRPFLSRINQVLHRALFSRMNTNSPADCLVSVGLPLKKKTRGGVSSGLPNRSTAFRVQSYLNGSSFMACPVLTITSQKKSQIAANMLHLDLLVERKIQN